MRGVISSILNVSTDFHFYVLVPTLVMEVWTEAFQSSNVTLLPYPTPPRIHGGDFYFDPAEMLRVLDLKSIEIDVLFLNQPEISAAFLQFFNKHTFHSIPAVSYTHWFDVRRRPTLKNVGWRPDLLSHGAGLLSCSINGVNSHFGEESVIRWMSQYVKDSELAKLKSRFRIIPPGIDSGELLQSQSSCKHTDGKNRVLINHRVLEYTGVRQLLQSKLSKIWDRRRDFKVVVTNPSRARVPGELLSQEWIECGPFNREDYISEMWRSDIVVSPHRSTHWSISTLEAIGCECVPLMTCESFFEELMRPVMQAIPDDHREYAQSRWFYYRHALAPKLERLLDDFSRDKEIVVKAAATARDHYDWLRQGQIWVSVFESVVGETKLISEENPSFKRLSNEIRKRGSITKKDALKFLGWYPKQRLLSWSSFRRRLLEDFVDNASQPESVYCER